MNDCLVVGICGGSASGKSRLSHTLSKTYCGRSTIINQDDYYHDSSHLSEDERRVKNYDHPDAIDLDRLYENLKGLKAGLTVEAPQYCFESHGRLPASKTLTPKNIIIVEGLFVFEQPELRRLFDLKIFISVENDVRLIRRIRRDVDERGRSLESVLDQYMATTKPMHDQFIEPASQYADLCIPCLDSDDMMSAVSKIGHCINDLTDGLH